MNPLLAKSPGEDPEFTSVLIGFLVLYVLATFVGFAVWVQSMLRHENGDWQFHDRKK